MLENLSERGLNEIGKWIIPNMNGIAFESENLRTIIEYDKSYDEFVGFVHKKREKDWDWYLFEFIRSRSFSELIRAIERYHKKAETGEEQQ